MTGNAPLKVSYCTTCKGRLHHLQQTLPANMAAEKDNPNVEFVVLDYGDEDGLGEWIKQNYQKEMDSGRLRYARFETDHFKMAHAKNMAHRLATGDILCNVDADNFIAPNSSRWLSETFTKHPNGFVTNLSVRRIDPWINGFKRVILRSARVPLSTAGRIAMPRTTYEQLHGYDESFNAWGYDDWNIALRARDADHRIVAPDPEQWGKAILHSDEERTENLSDQDKSISEGYFERQQMHKERPRALRLAHALLQQLELVHGSQNIANIDGRVGCGTVHVNFAPEPLTIVALPAMTEHEKSEDKAPIARVCADEPELRTDWAERSRPHISSRER